MNIQLLHLEAALRSAGYTGEAKDSIKKHIMETVRLLAAALALGPDEYLYCFFSPHAAPKGRRVGFPRGFDFIVPLPGERFDKHAVKAAFWIVENDEITDDSKHKVFFSSDGYAQIADDDWIRPDEFVCQMRKHMREGKPMQYLHSGPRDYAKEIWQKFIERKF